MEPVWNFRVRNGEATRSVTAQSAEEDLVEAHVGRLLRARVAVSGKPTIKLGGLTEVHRVVRIVDLEPAHPRVIANWWEDELPRRILPKISRRPPAKAQCNELCARFVGRRYRRLSGHHLVHHRMVAEHINRSRIIRGPAEPISDGIKEVVAASERWPTVADPGEIARNAAQSVTRLYVSG